MIREYKGKRYDMSRLDNRRWFDYCSQNPGIELRGGTVIVWAGGSFRYQGTDYERGLELVTEGRAILKTLEVIDD